MSDKIKELDDKIAAGFNTGSNHDYLDERDAKRELKEQKELLDKIIDEERQEKMTAKGGVPNQKAEPLS